MMKNVSKAEQIFRVALGIICGLFACFMNSLPFWARIGSGILAVAFFVTAFVGY